MSLHRTLLVVGLMGFLAGPVVGTDSPPTFNKDKAPILFAHCSNCHRPNEIGPFNLLTYADAKKRGRQLAEITEKRVMPPWKPVKGHGEFKYDRSLSDDQIAVFQNWHKAGMPEGAAQDLPAQPKFPEGWHLGTPDLILKVEKPFRIPAEGDDLYAHFVLPTGLKADQPFKAVQVLPSNRRVTHHAHHPRRGERQVVGAYQEKRWAVCAVRSRLHAPWLPPRLRPRHGDP